MEDEREAAYSRFQQDIGMHAAADAGPVSGNVQEHGQHLTDVGNARRLAELHVRDIKFCWPWNRWLVWDDLRWSGNANVTLERMAKLTIAHLYEQAGWEQDSARRKELAGHAMRSESQARVRAMIELARSEEGIPVLPEELDRDPWLLNVLNGTVDLRTGALREHRREDLITKLAPVSYDVGADCPRWMAFLDRIMAGDESEIEFLQMAVGYSLTADTREDCLFIAFGGGRNGKTTFMQTISRLLGDYGLRTPVETLMRRKHETIPNDIARLNGARFVHASETAEGQRLNEPMIKDLTGGDTLSARFLHGEWFDFNPVCKLWLSTNHKPVIRGTDLAIWRRIRLIPFEVTIPENEVRARDELIAEFMQEAPGILDWAITGCLAWQKTGLEAPEKVKVATQGYREEMDFLAGFIEDCCALGLHLHVSAADLYHAFTEWCRETGEHQLSQRSFGMRLAEKGFERRRGGSSGRVSWFGIGLLNHLNDTEPYSTFFPMRGESIEKHEKSVQYPSVPSVEGERELPF